MPDTELSKLINIPVRTIQDFKKNDKDNWRHIVYQLLSSMTKEQLEERMKALGLT